MTRLLATPSADRRFKSVFDARFGSYVARVRELVAMSKEQVVVGTPFIDEYGVKLLREAWEARKFTGNRLRIYVRDVDRTLEETSRANSWDLRVYKQIEEGPHNYGMHSKFVISDWRVAVIGSMNLIRTNMFHNLEIGVELDDPEHLKSLEKLEAYLASVSKRLR